MHCTSLAIQPPLKGWRMTGGGWKKKERLLSLAPPAADAGAGAGASGTHKRGM